MTVGDYVAVFNHLRFLEIANYKGDPGAANGGASSMLGIKLDDVIRIEFSE